MSPQTDPMETMLATLGLAQRDGAFSCAAARYPWQSDGGNEAVSRRHRRLNWVGVAIPLAAAAAVAVLFVGPSLFDSKTVHQIARNIPATVMPSQPEVLAEVQPAATSSAEAADCDYNGDGVIDGRDIQAFVDRLQQTGGDPDLQREYLQRCLLGK
jgi:hypothetical protein